MNKYIIGIDEAGRGPLAGPIVGAAVLNTRSSDDEKALEKVRDSKRLSTKQRENLFWPIIKNMIWSVRAYDNNFIDKYGIQTANILLVYELSRDLLFQSKGSAEVFSDYVGGADWLLKNIYFFKQGESKHKEIAAASIVAKVYRDKLMESLHKSFPDYGFLSHKGYGSKEHYKGLQKWGLSPVHRQSFLSKIM